MRLGGCILPVRFGQLGHSPGSRWLFGLGGTFYLDMLPGACFSTSGQFLACAVVQPEGPRGSESSGSPIPLGLHAHKTDFWSVAISFFWAGSGAYHILRPISLLLQPNFLLLKLGVDLYVRYKMLTSKKR